MRFFYIFILSLAVLIVLSWQAHAAPTITYYYDGDTVKIKDGKTTYKLRISEIDAPERNQHYGKKSRRALMQLCKNTQVNVEITGQDQYHRKVGQLFCNETNVSQFMVAEGHAWFSAKFSDNQQLEAFQKQAQQQKSGLWHTNKVTPPWVWRKRNHAAYKNQKQ